MGEFLGEGSRWPDQPHAGLAQKAVPLSPIAAAAGNHLVLPAVCRATAGGRHDVIHRKLGRRHGLVAVLTGALVAEQKVASVGAQHAARNLDIREETHHHDVVSEAAPCHGSLDRLPSIVIDKGDALLGEQDDQPPLTDDVKRL